MNKIFIQQFILENDNLIRAKVILSYKKYHKLIIMFKEEDYVFNIISTSQGIISENQIHITQQIDFVQVFLEDISKFAKCECILSYFDDKGELIHTDIMDFEIYNKISIKSSEQYADIVKSNKNQTFKNRMQQFAKTINEGLGSKWSVRLQYENDIIMYVRTKSQNNCIMSLGEHSESVIDSDIVFSVNKNCKKIILPIEALWLKYNKYNTKTIACYELVKPDFVNLSNLYYKRKISNYLNIEISPKIKRMSISEFTTPTGKNFEYPWKISEHSGLPIYE